MMTQYPIHREIGPAAQGPFASGSGAGALSGGDRPGISAVVNFIILQNESGADAPKGTTVKLALAGSKLAFTTSTTQGDERVCGVTLEAISSGNRGRVALAGRVRLARVASGATRGQWLRQSTTAGVLEGADSPKSGTIAIQTDSRDGTTGLAEIYLLRHSGATGDYDVASQGGYQLWDDFDTIVTISNFYTVAGAPTVVADATTGDAAIQLVGGTIAPGANAQLATAIRQFRAADNPSFKVIINQTVASSGGTVEADAGFSAGYASSGQQDGIYFRSVNGGNWFLVCRSAGAESTADMGVAPSTTKVALEFQVSGGNSVQAYVNGTLTGAALTTNIPAALGNAFARIDNRAGVVATGQTIRVFGWGWKAAG